VKNKLNVLFYHSGFFRRSETFIYRQAINPYIQPFLLSKRYYNLAELPTKGFTKFQFAPSLIDRIAYKWFKSGHYYGDRSITKMKRLLEKKSLDLLHAQFGGNGVRILPLAKQLNVPLIVSFHGFDASRKLSSRSYREGLKDVFDYASAIVICNPGMGDALPLNESHKAKVRWVPYGIDIEEFSNDTHPAQANSFSILHVGRLVEKKGVPDLIRAFAQATQNVDQMTLHIVGDGKEESECHELVAELNLTSKVIFHGWKTPHGVKELMQQCDVFVLNSRIASNGDTEGLPVGLLEAMAMGKAVISTYHAAIPLAVENEVSGLLVNERDTDSLSQQILRLFHDKELRHKLGQAARTKVENQFTMKSMHQKLHDIYYQVAGK
jgi:colanic acid/amylovoran biosynthesis glycosyltransferase